MTYMDFVYQPKIAADARRVHQLHHPGARRPGDRQAGRAEARPGDDKTLLRAICDQPAGLPDARPTTPSCTATGSWTNAEETDLEQHLRADLPVMIATAAIGRLAPYLSRPARLALAGDLLRRADAGHAVGVDDDRRPGQRLQADLPLGATTPTPGRSTTCSSIRSLVVRADRDRRSACCIAYPVAYWIAFRGGSAQVDLLFLLLLPFFVSFVIRTQSWKFMLSDNGMVLGAAEGPGAGVSGLPHPGRRRSPSSAG